MSKKKTYYVSSVKIIDDKNSDKQRTITLRSGETCIEFNGSQLSSKRKGRFFSFIFIIFFSAVIGGVAYLFISNLCDGPENQKYKLIEKILLPLALFGISLTSSIRYEGEKSDGKLMIFVLFVALVVAILLAMNFLGLTNINECFHNPLYNPLH